MYKQSGNSRNFYNFEVKIIKFEFKIYISCGSTIDEIWKIGKEMKMVNVSMLYEIKDELILFLLTEASFIQLTIKIFMLNNVKLGLMKKFI